MDFSDISQALKSHGINESNNKFGSYLKLLAPEGQEIKIKASNGVRHYINLSGDLITATEARRIS